MRPIKIVSINHDIKTGPDSGRLWDAAKYAYGKNSVDNFVFFDIKNPFPEIIPDEYLRLWFRPTEIQHEDGSGKSFNLAGFISKTCAAPRYAGRRFTAYYNCGSPRHGTIKIEMPQ